MEAARTPAIPEVPRLFSVNRLSERTGRHTQTILRRISQGKISPAFMLEGKRKDLPLFTSEAETILQQNKIS